MNLQIANNPGILYNATTMIDPHVHFRDWNQANKETVQHGLLVAAKAGVDGIFEMPNTDPPLLTQKNLVDRIYLAALAGNGVFHGIYGGLTADEQQIREMVKAYNNLFPRVVGFKLFAGKSTGDLSVPDETEQFHVFHILAASGYRGVVAVHCEKEALFRPELWDANDPSTHSLCRPPESEVESINDILRFAGRAGFKGRLHICHVSVPDSVFAVEKAGKDAAFSISCGITPHHSLLYDSMAQTNQCLKINPPLRPRKMQEQMLSLLMEGRIDWIETDHAPHAPEDKPAASGIPGLQFLPHFIRKLKTLGMAGSLLDDITHNNICKVFKIDIPNSRREAEYGLACEYPFDPYRDFTG